MTALKTIKAKAFDIDDVVYFSKDVGTVQKGVVTAARVTFRGKHGAAYVENEVHDLSCGDAEREWRDFDDLYENAADAFEASNP